MYICASKTLYIILITIFFLSHPAAVADPLGLFFINLAGGTDGAAGPNSGSGFADSYSSDLINLNSRTASRAPAIGPTQ